MKGQVSWAVRLKLSQVVTEMEILRPCSMASICR